MDNIDYIKKVVVPRTTYNFVEDAEWTQIPIKHICPNIVKNEVSYIKYDPNVDFQYATSERYMCDGTLVFPLMAQENILKKVINMETCYNKIDVSNVRTVNDFQYIIGDVVQCIEYGDFGTKEKPWLSQRITTFLPIKMIIKKEEK